MTQLKTTVRVHLYKKVNLILIKLFKCLIMHLNRKQVAYPGIHSTACVIKKRQNQEIN